MSGIPPHLLERLGGLELVARTVVQGFVSGVHRSPYKGGGREFAGHRPYQQGDEVRRIDWRLFGRSDRLYVREFREDANLQCYVVVDASASMGYADAHGLTKLRYAVLLAAVLAHLMLRAGDAVGLAGYGTEPRLLARPRSRRGYLHDLLLQLERLRPAGAAGAAEALERVGGALARRGRVVLISDLLEDDGGRALLGALGRLRARGDEVIVLRPLTPAEESGRGLAPGLLFDPERPDRAQPASPADDPGYAERVAEYYARLGSALRERGVEYVPLSTGVPLEGALGRWLAARAAGG